MSKLCLVVDDVEVTRFSASEFLSELGFTADCAETSAEALKKIQEKKYDLILLDWFIGKESGIELLKKIQSEGLSDAPIGIITGVEEESKSQEAIDAGACFFLVKPTTKEKIEQAIKTCVIR